MFSSSYNSSIALMFASSPPLTTAQDGMLSAYSMISSLRIVKTVFPIIHQGILLFQLDTGTDSFLKVLIYMPLEKLIRVCL